MKKTALFFSLAGAVFFWGCTAIPDVGTRAYVYDRMNSIRLGNTPEQVQYTLDGPPSYVSAVRQGSDIYELWEYKIGNFLYAETSMILFRNGRVMALPRSGHELIRILNDAGVVAQAEFWESSPKK